MDAPTAPGSKPPSGASSTTKMISSIDADSSAPRGPSPLARGRDLRLLRRAIQYREEIQADQVNDALLLRQRAFAPQLVAEHARRGQLGREAAPDRRAAPGDGFRGKEVPGFRVDGTRRAHAQRALRGPERAHRFRRRHV